MVAELLGYCAVATAALQGLGFVHGYLRQTESLYDAIGGLNSLLFVVLAVVLSPDDFASDAAKPGAAVLFGLSRAWLLGFLAWRARERGGDGRFDQIKPFFVSFAVAWFLQGAWVLSVAMPTIVICGLPGGAMGLAASLALLACAALFAAGLSFQVAADVQKARWVSGGRVGGFCDRGTWRYSRHPNYFGEMLMSWAAWGAAAAAAFSTADAPGCSPWWAAAALACPLVTTILLVFVSGLPTAEGANLKRYYSGVTVEQAERYKTYRADTSILVPMAPAVWRLLPTVLRRTFLFEWPMYEYKAPADRTTTGVDSGELTADHGSVSR